MVFRMKRCAPTADRRQTIARSPFNSGRSSPDSVAEIELSVHFDSSRLARSRFFHCRLNADSVRCGFSRIDVVVELIRMTGSSSA